MDTQLPEENGIKLSQKIKVNHPDIIVVLLTSCDFPEYREAAIQHGVSSFITKDLLNLEESETLVKSISEI